MRVRDAVVVVTGASSGIGRASALALADAGAHLVLAARRPAALEEVAQECRSRGAEALVVPTDVSDADAVAHLGQAAVDRFGRVDVWLNSAVVMAFGRLDQVPLADTRRLVEVNLLGAVHQAREALRRMREQGRGVHITVSSVLAATPQAQTVAYDITKAGMRALAVSLRQELRQDGLTGISVCTVLPAAVDTPIWRSGANHTGRVVRAMPPRNSPEQVARTVVDLVRVPRREAPVGFGARQLLALARVAPVLNERLLGFVVPRLQLTAEPAAPSSGNLHAPSGDTGSVDGGWGGRRATTKRRVAGAALTTAAAALVTARTSGGRLRRP